MWTDEGGRGRGGGEGEGEGRGHTSLRASTHTTGLQDGSRYINGSSKVRYEWGGIKSKRKESEYIYKNI